MHSKHFRLALIVFDLVIAVVFIVVTSLVCAGYTLQGLYVAMVILAILLFIATLTLLASFFNRNNHRDGDPD